MSARDRCIGRLLVDDAAGVVVATVALAGPLDVPRLDHALAAVARDVSVAADLDALAAIVLETDGPKPAVPVGGWRVLVERRSPREHELVIAADPALVDERSAQIVAGLVARAYAEQGPPVAVDDAPADEGRRRPRLDAPA
ncbi:MAG: hypothetical protein JWP17_3875, partial [Solirubrobacterales bacterium]|nr:hypothetical protein [Solirubrobacterales bacterium]